MTQISQPDTTVNIIGANVTARNAAQRALFLGQKLAGGTAVAGALTRDVEDSQVAGLVGTGGMLEDAITAFREINPLTPIDLIALDDPAGSQSVGEFIFSGAPTEAGTLEFGVGSPRNGVASIAVLTTDTPTSLAAKLAAAYATKTSCVCALAVDGVDDTQVNVTYRHAGTEGDEVPLRVVGKVAGLSVAITAMTGGAGVPTLPTISTIVGNTRYQQVMQPGSYGVANLKTLLDARWNVQNRVLDGVGIVTLADTKANHVTALNLLNSQNIVYQCEGVENEADYKGPSIFENLFARSAMIGAIKALRLTDGANITRYVNAAGGPNDGTGGPALASLPYFNTPLPLPVMEVGFGFDDTEIEEIVAAGGFVVGNNVANNGIIIGEVPTTYKTDAGGSEDPSFKYLNYVDTSSQAREFMFNNIKKDCAQSRLTLGDLVPNRNINNEASIRAKFIRYFGILAKDPYVLVQDGEEARNFFIQNLSVAIDLVTGLVTVNMKVPIVTQLRTIVANLQLAFSLN